MGRWWQRTALTRPAAAAWMVAPLLLMPPAAGASPAPAEHADESNRPPHPSDLVLAQASGRPAPRPPVPLPAEDPPASASGEPTTTAQADDPTAARPNAQKPSEQLLLETGAILLPAGTLQIEPSFDYTHFSGNRVAISGLTLFESIVIGRIQVDQMDRDVLTGAVTGRLGITDRLQLDLRVPVTWREDEEVLAIGTGDEAEIDSDNLGLGDISGTLSFQPFIGSGWLPDIIVRAEGAVPTGEHSFEIDTVEVADGIFRLERPPTGSGFYSVGGGATFVWSSDPVVFFAGGGYKFNLKRDFGGVGTINPGDTVDLFAGLNIGLSERISLNMSFVDQISDGTKVDGVEAPGTEINDGRLIFGSSIGLGPRTSLLVSAGAGLTHDSPDFQFTVSLPISFDLF